jgi:hypothetical protein
VNYLFLTNHGSNEHPELVVQPFDANTELNDYEVSHAFPHPHPFPDRASSAFLILSFFSSFFRLYHTNKDPLGVTRIDRGRARGSLLRERFRQPAQRFP